MTLKLGHIAPLLFTCIRSSTSTARAGYPLGDDPIISLVSTEFSAVMPLYDKKAAILLAAWFCTVTLRLEALADDWDKFESLVALNNFGIPGHKRQRRDFFEEVTSSARILLLSPVANEDYNAIFQHHLTVPSNRTSARDQNAVPLPVFVGVGFDVLQVELPPITVPVEIVELKHIQKYGRPLWISLVRKRFWAVATQKLLGMGDFAHGNYHFCFNVLASQLALQYTPTCGTGNSLFGKQASFARSKVDRHMQILDKVDEDAILHIQSPLEPVLAIAASLVMMPTPNQAATDMPVPKQLALNCFGSILETVKTTCLGSHFDILDIKVQTISPKYLWYCWKHGVAIQMSHAQHGIDSIIPVFVGNLHQGLGSDWKGKRKCNESDEGCRGENEKQAARQMTFVAWEAKNQVDPVPSKALAAANKVAHAGPELQHEPNLVPPLTNWGLLTILADVGIQDLGSGWVRPMLPGVASKSGETLCSIGFQFDSC
ncbi:uncharacterized protein MEPE_04833 [Melanopsichium pennsylvanicum]|uniref:Uncharacterized protein n=1 Tax=Melanopsichium pennsylvanicum TaxID=63383 RepID=A0AAJ4XNE3_9BASI|nr:uncharacterized protein MEPE_04833 [Melanopsichium pennsylvanicum]